jgi:hypothetical protein
MILMMPIPDTNAAVELCERVLLDDIRYNEEHSILARRNSVARRLLGRRVELVEAYTDLVTRLRYERPIAVVLDQILVAATYWNKDETTKMRLARADLEQVNRRISRTADELADLLEQRTHLHNHSEFSSETYYHPIDLMEVAAKGNGLYGSFLKDKLDALRYQFDLKYWPSLSTMTRALAADARGAVVSVTDEMTEAATTGKRASDTDFFRAFYVGLEHCKTALGGLVPDDYEMVDRTLAALATCALGKDPDEPFTSDYVKQCRARIRAAQG